MSFPPHHGMSSEGKHFVSSVVPKYLVRAISHRAFNRMQSECLDVWHSNENMLICAPTGAGKTVCFDLAILRIVHENLVNSEEKYLGSRGLGGKIVYVAPTKALCSERANSWQTQLAYLGVHTEVVTGDTGGFSFDSRLRDADVVVTTAEKWDSVTRGIGSQSQSLLSQIQLLLLDEVHQVGDTRGATFEAVVTRMLVARDECALLVAEGGKVRPVASLRVIGVSATVGNVSDLARWLRVSSKCIRVFDTSYRPVPLQFHVLGYTAKNPWLYSRVYNKQLLRILKEYNDGKPSIVFCTSRKQTIVAAKSVLEELQRNGSNSVPHVNPLTQALSNDERRRLYSAGEACGDALLKTLLPSGIAIHNADMSPKCRKMVERLFRDCVLPCLFSTSTLAQGVNLPVRLVVIAGTTVYHEGSLREYNRNTLMQMCGRAGRLGLDTKGVVVIMTPQPNVSSYKALPHRSASILRSQLSSRLEEAVNAEVARHVIVDIPSAVQFLSSTFFWTQSRASKVQEGSLGSNELDREISSVALSTMNNLSEAGLVQYDADYFGISSSLAGLYMARYCLSYRTMRILREKISTAASPSQILTMIASCPDVLEGVCVRRAEKKRLNELNEWVRMPVHGKVKEAVDKAVVLLQVAMGDQQGSRASDFSLRSEGQRMLQAAARVSGCLVALVLRKALKAPYEAVTAVLQVCRGLLNGCLWDGPTVLRQVPGIKPPDLKVLAKCGISSLANLAEAGPHGLRDNTDYRPALNGDLLERMRALPKFIVKTEVHRDENRIRSVVVHVDVVSLSGREKPLQRKGLHFFILIGSHCRGLLHCSVLRLQDGRQTSVLPIPVEKAPSTRRWIDVTVGCDGFVGTDVTHRLWDLEDQNRHLVEQSRVPKKSCQVYEEKKPSVTARRVSKTRTPRILATIETEKALDIAQQTYHSKQGELLQPSSAPASGPSVEVQTSLTNEGAQRVRSETGKPLKRRREMLPLVPDEPADLPAVKKATSEKQTKRTRSPMPARCESHIIPSSDEKQKESEEYDQLFRSLF